jgi:hypothetical protein
MRAPPMSEHQSGADDVVAARLMADPEPDGPVGVPLAVLDEHLDRFAAINPAAFRQALERFTADRPFLTTEDALRAVLRDFGMRAKLTPAHLSIEGLGEDGWRLMEIHPDDLSRSRRI